MDDLKKLSDLMTPALIADEAVLAENERRMAALLAGTPLKLRPHYKSHKCAELAKRQIASGAVGMTCATIWEAEDLAKHGIEDILLANMIVSKEKIERAAVLAKQVRLKVLVDDAGNARTLSEAMAAAGAELGILVEYDIGMNRCGVRTEEEYLALAKTVEALPNLRYCGIQAYAGHLSHTVSGKERADGVAENGKKIRKLIALLQENGITVETVSGGSTGTAEIKAREGLYTELQAGSYLFLDNTYRELDLPFQNSLYVLSTVVSRREGLFILDAGVKELGADQEGPRLFTQDGTEITGRFELNEEHLKVFEPSVLPPLGEKLLILPGHCCTTVNLHKRILLVRDGVVIDSIQKTA